jgi:pectin lyase
LLFFILTFFFSWGGDAITVAGSDNVWVDHVKISLIGRQMFVAGTNGSGRVTISNSEFDGQTSWSATCDNRHYWAIYLTGSNDFITLSGNYIHHTSGRSPKVGGTTLVHAVNNMWHDNTGHAFDIGSSGSRVVAEGNVFQNVKTPLLANSGKLFSAPGTSANTACASYLKHNCQLNAFGSSGSFAGSDTSFFSQFNGYTVASASAASSNVRYSAGVGKI